MGSSSNTALSPSIPLTRRVINKIEEHQRTVLDSYAECMDREMNTSPVLSSEEQQVEIMTTSTGPQPVDTHIELQDNTLQLESPEMEDTAVVDPGFPIGGWHAPIRGAWTSDVGGHTPPDLPMHRHPTG